jgi:pilus assembly protein Flp/PilA
MVRLAMYLRSLVRKDEGQDLLEYALLVALIALGAVLAVTAAGDQVEIIFNDIAEALTNAT